VHSFYTIVPNLLPYQLSRNFLDKVLFSLIGAFERPASIANYKVHILTFSYKLDARVPFEAKALTL